MLYTELLDNQFGPICMDSCITSLTNWILHNGMIVNLEKTEVLALGMSAHLKKANHTDPVLVVGTAISPSATVKVIGVMLDSALNFDQHVSDVCRVWKLHLRTL
jgi:hypothetical protein